MEASGAAPRILGCIACEEKVASRRPLQVTTLKKKKIINTMTPAIMHRVSPTCGEKHKSVITAVTSPLCSHAVSIDVFAPAQKMVSDGRAACSTRAQIARPNKQPKIRKLRYINTKWRPRRRLR